MRSDIIMGKNKPRTATHRKANQWVAENGNVCEYWDNGFPECFLPWGKPNGGCNGNPFICKKLYLKYIASNPKPTQHIINEFERRERK